MVDKVQKIREEVERRINELQPCNTSDNLRAHGAIAGYYQILSFIDSMQEEPKKCMYSKDNFTDEDRKALCDGCEKGCEYAQKKEYDVCDFCDEKNTCVDPCCVKLVEKQEPITYIDFEQELYKAFGQVKDFTLGIQIAKRFYEMGKQHQEPVSEDLLVAANKAFQESEDKESYAETFEDGFVAGADWQKRKDSISSKDLEELINNLSKRYPEVSFAKLSRIAVHVVKWQKQKTLDKACNFLEMLGQGFTITDDITHNPYKVEQLITDFKNYIKD